MPIIYGEGKQSALYRLQVEIFQSTDDYSIFAFGSLRKKTPREDLEALTFPIKEQGGLLRWGLLRDPFFSGFSYDLFCSDLSDFALYRHRKERYTNALNIGRPSIVPHGEWSRFPRVIPSENGLSAYPSGIRIQLAISSLIKSVSDASAPTTSAQAPPQADEYLAILPVTILCEYSDREASSAEPSGFSKCLAIALRTNKMSSELHRVGRSK